jgi:hypothetical protein
VCLSWAPLYNIGYIFAVGRACGAGAGKSILADVIRNINDWEPFSVIETATFYYAMGTNE